MAYLKAFLLCIALGCMATATVASLLIRAGIPRTFWRPRE